MAAPDDPKAMEPSLQQKLVEKQLSTKALEVLKMENYRNKETLMAMADSDLEELWQKHDLPLGDKVILRRVRDDCQLPQKKSSKKSRSVRNPMPHGFASEDRIPLMSTNVSVAEINGNQVH